MYARLALICMASLATACGSAHPLNAYGESVTVTVDDGVYGCRYLTTVTSTSGGNFRSYEANVERCAEDLRNKAGQRGATHLVMSAPEVTDGTAWTMGSECRNCVAMSAQAYVCDGTEVASTPTRRRPRSLPRGMGAERGECYPNHTCNEGLTCLSNLCVDATPDAPAAATSVATSAAPPTAEIAIAQCAGPADASTCAALGSELVRDTNPEARTRGMSYLRTACQADMYDACATLGYTISTGSDEPDAQSAAVVHFQRACRGGNARGCTFLGAMLETGKGFEQDRQAALSLYRKACAAGHEAACARQDQLAP